MVESYKPYLTIIRDTLEQALCLKNFPSQLYEKINRPQVEVRESLELINKPVIISRNEAEKYIQEYPAEIILCKMYNGHRNRYLSSLFLCVEVLYGSEGGKLPLSDCFCYLIGRPRTVSRGEYAGDIRLAGSTGADVVVFKLESGNKDVRSYGIPQDEHSVAAAPLPFDLDPLDSVFTADGDLFRVGREYVAAY